VADALTFPVRIKLQEYGEPVFHQAEDINLGALAEANSRWRRILGLSVNPIRVEEIGGGLVKLRAEAVTGVVRIGDIDIEIAPKFLSTADGSWQTVLWRILTVVEGGHVDDDLTAAHHLSLDSIPDMLAEMFLTSYAKGAARGLPRSYLAVQETGNTLRGKLDTSRLDEWVTRPWKLPYVADVLSDDTAFARLLRWSAECLATTVIAPGRARALREISAGLANVSKRPPHLFEAQRISLGPQYRGLEAARLVGLMLLEGSGVHHASGEHALSGFLWNSDVIYENYVYWLCRRAASQRGKRVNKDELTFGQIIKGRGNKLKTTPDVVFHDSLGVPVAVTDAKYKHLGLRPKSADTYQILTAGHVLGCQRVSLTYPVAIALEPTIWLVPSALGGQDIELTALPINLMGLVQPKGQKYLIDSIGAWLDGELFATD
jgi:5-methylcytosine-specific restriction endonuclease McrBC regulatory subunit McrC